MPKYEIDRSYPAPALDRARSAPGLHVHTDASGDGGGYGLAVLVERVSTDGTRETITEWTGNVTEENVNRAEAAAALKGVQLATAVRTADEHVFLYIDSRVLVDALYGRSRIPDSTRNLLQRLLDTLPDPTMYTIIEIDRQMNKAHTLARESRE